METGLVAVGSFIGTLVGAWLLADAIADHKVVKRDGINGDRRALVSSRFVRELSGFMLQVLFLMAAIIALTLPDRFGRAIIWILVLMPYIQLTSSLYSYTTKQRLLKKGD